MATPRDPDAVREGLRRLAAQRARAARIRRRIAAGSLATFVLSFGTIAGSGALGSTTGVPASTATSTSQSFSQGTVSPVTTSQS
jgi:hypothetical protein